MLTLKDLIRKEKTELLEWVYWMDKGDKDKLEELKKELNITRLAMLNTHPRDGLIFGY